VTGTSQPLDLQFHQLLRGTMRLIGTILTSAWPGFMSACGVIRKGIGGFHPEIVVGLAQDLYVIQHLDPIGPYQRGTPSRSGKPFNSGKG